ncbi:MAG: CocE/NonD family hydrolase [Planctomycetes bacterium]|nr:CocE/NonD family hydrolase [Planctomycetota bacterium]
MSLPGLLALILAAQQIPTDQGVYILRIGGKEMGEETVTFTRDGWSAKGRYDIMGLRKAEYEASRAGSEWSLTLKDGKGETRTTATLHENKVTFRTLPDGPEKSLDVEAPYILFENLVWSPLIDLGRYLAAHPTPDASITAVLVTHPVKFPIQLREVAKLAHGPHELWEFTADLGPVETILICSPDGLPLRVLVPAQHVDVALKGFESIEARPKKPVSIVDSGDWRKTLSKPTHETVVETKVMIPMRDGVKLAADIHRPKDGKVPTILVRTPYSRATEAALKGAHFAKRGYALVAQDVRGRFDSEGEWFPFKNETQDGSDTIDWIARQPWSDGNVGMLGASYVGVVQWHAAKSGNPHLKAIVPQVSPPDPDQNIPYEGGCFVLATAWWAKVLEAITTSEDFSKLNWIKLLDTIPLNELDTALGVKHRFIDEWLEHPPADETYWSPMRYQTHFDRMDVAALHISGWFDGDQPGAVQNFVGMRRHAKTESARRAQYLIMGPWGHAFNAMRKLGDVDLGPQAVIDLDSVILRFFDRYLKAVDNGIDREDPVCFFVTGENTWRRDKDWPPSQTHFTNLHLAGQKANLRDGGGTLATTPSGEPDVYRYDPRDVPETIADFNDFVGASVTADLSKLPDREDVLDYTSPPLAEAIDLVGPFTATLWVSTTAEDTDFYVGILRLSPDGKLTGVTGGIQRLRYRTGRDEPVKPEEVVRIEVDCWASGLRLEKGDRIRIEVSSNAFPGYARNMNTLESQAIAKTPKVATNRVHHDAERPSHVRLPVVGGALRFME